MQGHHLDTVYERCAGAQDLRLFRLMVSAIQFDHILFVKIKDTTHFNSQSSSTSTVQIVSSVDIHWVQDPAPILVLPPILVPFRFNSSNHRNIHHNHPLCNPPPSRNHNYNNATSTTISNTNAIHKNYKYHHQ